MDLKRRTKKTPHHLSSSLKPICSWKSARFLTPPRRPGSIHAHAWLKHGEIEAKLFFNRNRPQPLYPHLPPPPPPPRRRLLRRQRPLPRPRRQVQKPFSHRRRCCHHNAKRHCSKKWALKWQTTTHKKARLSKRFTLRPKTLKQLYRTTSGKTNFHKINHTEPTSLIFVLYVLRFLLTNQLIRAPGVTPRKEGIVDLLAAITNQGQTYPIATTCQVRTHEVVYWLFDIGSH